MGRPFIDGNLRAEVVIYGLLAGCVSITLPTDTSTSDPDNTQQDHTGNSNDPNNDVLTAVLSVSNPNPQVGEEVTLSCNISSGAALDPVFDFQPSDRLISIDAINGSAVFIVDETDTGTEFTFTCTVTISGVTGEPSQPQTFIPTAGVSP